MNPIEQATNIILAKIAIYDSAQPPILGAISLSTLMHAKQQAQDEGYSLVAKVSIVDGCLVITHLQKKNNI